MGAVCLGCDGRQGRADDGRADYCGGAGPLQAEEQDDSVRVKLVDTDGSGLALAYTAPSYYTLSVILGTVALSYGSVPLYKMVCYALLRTQYPSTLAHR